jgi:glycosyltransferase involved in cell wall biosynthesis
VKLAFAYHRLAPETVGGANRYYAMLCAALAAAGHEVTYLTRGFWGPEPEMVRDGVRHVAMSRADAAAFRTEAGELSPKIRYSAGLGRHLMRSGADYDIVHVCCFPYPAVLAAGAGLARFAETRLVVDWHEVLPPATWRGRRGRGLGSVGALLQARALGTGDAAIAFSHLHGERLRATRTAPPAHVFPEFLPGGAAPPELPGKREKLIVFAGRLVDEKGAQHLPGVVARLRAEDPAWRAVIFGEGPAEQLVREAVAAHRVADAVELRGFAPWDEVSQTFLRASALVFPSVREGFGLVVLEAAAHGLPVVLLRAPDNAAVELVEPGRNGAIAAGTSPEELAGLVLALATPDRPSAVRGWYAEAEQRLNVAASVRAHEALHRQLLPTLAQEPPP